MDSLFPQDVPEEWRRAFKAVLENPPKDTVDTVIHNGEELPYCGGIAVIATPGHTPGHLSLYHRLSKTLIAGDALIVENGELYRPDPTLCFDPDTAVQSLKELTRFEIQRVICFHGGLYEEKVNERIAELAGCC